MSHICPICNKDFKYPSGLTRHLNNKNKCIKVEQNIENKEPIELLPKPTEQNKSSFFSQKNNGMSFFDQNSFFGQNKQTELNKDSRQQKKVYIDDDDDNENEEDNELKKKYYYEQKKRDYEINEELNYIKKNLNKGSNNVINNDININIDIFDILGKISKTQIVSSLLKEKYKDIYDSGNRSIFPKIYNNISDQLRIMLICIMCDVENEDFRSDNSEQSREHIKKIKSGTFDTVLKKKLVYNVNNIVYNLMFGVDHLRERARLENVTDPEIIKCINNKDVLRPLYAKDIKRHIILGILRKRHTIYVYEKIKLINQLNELDEKYKEHCDTYNEFCKNNHCNPNPEKLTDQEYRNKNKIIDELIDDGVDDYNQRYAYYSEDEDEYYEDDEYDDDDDGEGKAYIDEETNEVILEDLNKYVSKKYDQYKNEEEKMNDTFNKKVNDKDKLLKLKTKKDEKENIKLNVSTETSNEKINKTKKVVKQKK